MQRSFETAGLSTRKPEGVSDVRLIADGSLSSAQQPLCLQWHQAAGLQVQDILQNKTAKKFMFGQSGGLLLFTFVSKHCQE